MDNPKTYGKTSEGLTKEDKTIYLDFLTGVTGRYYDDPDRSFSIEFQDEFRKNLAQRITQTKH